MRVFTFQYLLMEKHSLRRRYLYASANNHGEFMKSLPWKYFAISLFHMGMSPESPVPSSMMGLRHGNVSKPFESRVGCRKNKKIAPQLLVGSEIVHESIHTLDAVDEIDDAVFVVLKIGSVPKSEIFPRNQARFTCSFRVRTTSSIALPRIVGRRLPMVA